MTDKIAVANLDDMDLQSLRMQARAAPRKAGGATTESRRTREKFISPLDGRRNREQKLRETPLNVDVPPEIKQLVVRARADFGIPMKAFVAEAIQRYWNALQIEIQS